MRIETLLSKFAIKGINYDPQSGGGKALLYGLKKPALPILRRFCL